jgi:hypothetical protein
MTPAGTMNPRGSKNDSAWLCRPDVTHRSTATALIAATDRDKRHIVNQLEQFQIAD